jgi:hypothetical protein
LWRMREAVEKSARRQKDAEDKFFEDPKGLEQQEAGERFWSEAQARSTAINQNTQNELAEARRKRAQDDLETERRAAEDLAEVNRKAAQDAKEAWATGLGSIAGEFLKMAAAGEVSVDQLAKQLAILAIQMAAMSMGGAPGAFLSGLIGGFAHGGVIAEGGGGTDSQLVAFRKSPNERVTIETPEQQRTGSLRGGSGGGMPAVHIHMSNDRRDLVAGMDSREGARVNVNLRRKYG